MTRAQWVSPMLVWVLVTIGCGGRPKEVSAAVEQAAQAKAPIQQSQGGVGVSGGSASITGAIRFVGTAPTRDKVKMDADPVCQQQHSTPVLSEEVAVNDNGALKNVLVYVKEGAKGSFPAPATPVKLDQAGCWYAPRVFGIQAGQPLEIVNSDATLHNVNAKPLLNAPFNIAQPVKGMKTTKTFAKPELGVKFKCNVHPWMSAYAGVFDHPFFSVSGADGSFAITGLPAGTYTIEAWHEKYGAQTQTVTVADGESATIELTFEAQ